MEEEGRAGLTEIHWYVSNHSTFWITSQLVGWGLEVGYSRLLDSGPMCCQFWSFSCTFTGWKIMNPTCRAVPGPLSSASIVIFMLGQTETFHCQLTMLNTALLWSWLAAQTCEIALPLLVWMETFLFRICSIGIFGKEWMRADVQLSGIAWDKWPGHIQAVK